MNGSIAARSRRVSVAKPKSEGRVRRSFTQRGGLLSERPLTNDPERSHEGPSEEDPRAAVQRRLSSDRDFCDRVDEDVDQRDCYAVLSIGSSVVSTDRECPD